MRAEDAEVAVGKHLSALLLYVQRQLEGGRGAVVSVKPRRVCGDRRCRRAVNKLMMRLVEGGLARQHKRGVYLIEREAGEEVLRVLKRWMQQLTSSKPSLNSSAASELDL
jgi:hypothetical protein